MVKRYTEGYKIISDGTDYFIAETNNKRLTGPNIVAKLNTDRRFGSPLVLRNGVYYPSAIEVGDLSIHLREETDNNMVSISGADPVKMPWSTVIALIESQERKADFDARKEYHKGGAVTTSNITINAPSGGKMIDMIHDVLNTSAKSSRDSAQ